MNNTKITGWLLIAGAAGVLLPYTLLTISFDYPDILRQETGTILTRFKQGGSPLIFTWFAFALLGLPLIPAYVRIGQMTEKTSILARTATVIGVTGLIVQMTGLLRWTFVVPVLADTYVNNTDAAMKAAAVVSFKTIHQFAGVAIGEHLGQLFTVIWTILISIVLIKTKLLPKWAGRLGILAALIYVLAQAELLSTVMPGMPVWELAGFAGSTLWLIWLIITGVLFIRRKTTPPVIS